MEGQGGSRQQGGTPGRGGSWGTGGCGRQAQGAGGRAGARPTAAQQRPAPLQHCRSLLARQPRAETAAAAAMAIARAHRSCQDARAEQRKCAGDVSEGRPPRILDPTGRLGPQRHCDGLGSGDGCLSTLLRASRPPIAPSAASAPPAAARSRWAKDCSGCSSRRRFVIVTRSGATEPGCSPIGPAALSPGPLRLASPLFANRTA